MADSVVALWTPTVHASGFVIDAKGLIATISGVIGGATSVEVQITPAIKVAGRVPRRIRRATARPVDRQKPLPP